MIKQSIKIILKKLSYEIKKIKKINPLIFNLKNKNNFEEYYEICKNESLNVSKERFVSLYQTVNYIYKNHIDGDFVECGVFMGGSAMMMSYAMSEFEIKNKNKMIWLYDTFEGMANPSVHDKNILNEKATIELKNTTKKENSKDIWAYSSINYVKENINKTNISSDRIKYIKGLVEETLSKDKPKKISLLRLDTDFYESTKVELEELYPLLEIGGVIIIDDYGHWKGCKKAVDEYFENKKNIFFQQIDYSGLIGVKTK
tara:strand:- start:81 stop:854 length:774 start_codon:yes stop_codon:yes gene_type:complete